MIMSEQDKLLYKELGSANHSRLEPYIKLFEELVPEAGISFYNPTVLYLTVKGQISLGLSPRKQYISLYMGSMETMKIFRELLPRLGKVKTGVGCINIRKHSDLNEEVLKEAFVRIANSDHTGAYGFGS